jgi:hypothetical protein
MPSSVLVYVVARTIAAVTLAVVARLRGQPWHGFIGQLAADGLFVLLVAAFGDHELRHLLGWWALPAWIYVAAWEGTAAVLRWGELDEVGRDVEYVDILTTAWRRVWDSLLVVPPLVLGLAVVTELIVPGYVPLPGRPPAIHCAPSALDSHDTLHVRLEPPHGGELTVITPAGRSLIVVPFAAASVPRAKRFEEQPETAFVVAHTTGVTHGGAAAELVFTDTGRYLIRVSGVAEVAASLTCTVRFTSASVAAPPLPR